MSYMWYSDSLTSPMLKRRDSPRISVETFCSDHTGDKESHALIIDLSEAGMRVQRPLVGVPRSRVLQLEFEVPGVDELIWAKGEVCFDEVWRVPPAWESTQLSGVVRTSGIRLAATSSRHQRLLREYVNDTWNTERPLDPNVEALMNAACHRYG